MILKEHVFSIEKRDSFKSSDLEVSEKQSQFYKSIQQSPIYLDYLKKLNLDPKITPVYLALFHASFVNEEKFLGLSTYERFEFLGDSCLELMATDMLIRQYPEMSEGELSKLRSHLVSMDSWFELASLLKIEQLIFTGKNEAFLDMKKSKKMLTDVFEATIGVVYFYHGLEKSIDTFIKVLSLYFSETGKDFIHVDKVEGTDPKTQLQEELHRLYKENPRYVTNAIDHQTFEVSICLTIDGVEQVLISKVGKNRKETEKELAKVYLEKLKETQVIA